jgi:hypothetical protein
MGRSLSVLLLRCAVKVVTDLAHADVLLAAMRL